MHKTYILILMHMSHNKLDLDGNNINEIKTNIVSFLHNPQGEVAEM